MMAGWQSGYAADCKSVDAGSIPTSASIFFRLNPNTAHRPDGEIGRHKGFKIPRSLERAGSSPALGTILFDCFNRGFALLCLPNGWLYLIIFIKFILLWSFYLILPANALPQGILLLG